MVKDREPITRKAVIEETLHDLEARGLEGDFSGMGMLITDAVLSADSDALLAARDGLRHLIVKAEQEQIGFSLEQVGRTRALLIGALSGLARIAPDKPDRPRARTIVTINGI